jgi:hypothetical protein
LMQLLVYGNLLTGPVPEALPMSLQYFLIEDCLLSGTVTVASLPFYRCRCDCAGLLTPTV